MIRKYLQLWWQLAPLHRAGAVVLCLGNLAASLLEVVGLALFGAVLLRLTQAGSSLALLGFAGIPGLVEHASLRGIAAACGVVYVVKNAVMLGLAWLEARLTFGVQTHLTVHTLDAMLRQDYEDATRGNQNARLNLLSGGMYSLAFNVLLPGLTLVAETTLMVALVLFLVITQPPFVAGMLVALCAVAGLMVLVSRRLVLTLGGARHRADDEKVQLLNAIFGHLREMYVYSAGARAVAHLQGLLTRLAAAYRGFQMLQTSPRFFLETALVGVLLAVVFLRAPAGIDHTMIVSFGVFGVAGFRLLLGINRILASVQAMRFAGPTIDRIIQALDVPPAPAAPFARRHGAGPGGALRLHGVCYAYEAGKPVLQGLELALERGALVAIKGRSGAGKSTLMDILAGLRTPTDGWIELDGRRIAHKQELMGRVAYAGQQPAVFPDTIRANVAFGRAAESVDDAAVWRALERAHLDELVRALPGQLDFRLGLSHSLSGGQAQRLALARALYVDCEYLLLDEPTASLDGETELQLLSTLRELATTTGVVVVSHRPAPLAVADTVLELTGGRLRPVSEDAPRAGVPCDIP